MLRRGIRKINFTDPWVKRAIQIRKVVTNSTTADDSSSGAETLRFKMYSDPDERRGYKFDGNLDLTALIDRSNAMGFINASDADGFKARDFRTGGEPPDPEKAKEIMVFFKNRPKPPNRPDSCLRDILQASKEKIVGHAKEVASSILNQKPRPSSKTETETDVQRSSGRNIFRAVDKALHQHSDQTSNASVKVKTPPTNSHFNKFSGRKPPPGLTPTSNHQPPRGNYKLSKPPKKTINQS